MAKRKCLLTGYETNCTDGCYNCGCGGEVALNDYYVPIYNIQRVCDIVKNMENVSAEGEEIVEYIRNELERLVVVKPDAPPVRRGRWELTNNASFRKCSECCKWNDRVTNFCPNCGVAMRGKNDD